MINYFKNKIHAYFDSNSSDSSGVETHTKLSTNMLDNLIKLREKFSNSADFLTRTINVADQKITIITIEGMADQKALVESFVDPLINAKFPPKTQAMDIYNFIEVQNLMAMDLKDVYTTEELFNFIMSGFVVILIDNLEKGIALGLQGFNFRSISEPSSEVNIRGSREGFIEALRVNMTMIRRRIKSPTLKFELFNMGKKSQTNICMIYLTDVVSKKLLREVRQRLRSIDMDIILEGGYIQPYLEGKNFSMFSDVGQTERPDTLCAKINEGRIGILIDGTPFALILPYLFSENFQTFDDYTHRAYYTSFMRIIRYISFFFTILLPGIYVALGTFHPELFPYAILFNIASAQETTPFPLAVEALIIHFIYEVMREAGLRLPRPVGHAVSIVGALVIGDAAVTAGLIGAPMVMVVAITAISSFIVPSIYEPVSILRFGFIIVGGTLGFFGITLGLALLSINMCMQSSYGVPYMSPITPFSLKSMRDVFIKINWKRMNNHADLKNLKGVHINNSGGDDS